MEWPPSMPIMDAILPAAKAASTSSAVVASWNVSGYRSIIWYTMSISSMVARVASLPCMDTGT